MNKKILFLLSLLLAGLSQAQAQSRSSRSSASQRASRAADDEEKPQIYIGRVKLKKPIIVFYQQPPPSKSVQQYVMDEDQLNLVRTLTPEELAERREIFVDGLGNLELPGTDAKKFRLLGPSVVADNSRQPVGDGRSTYAKLKVPGSGELYVVRESAEEYRHFIKGPQRQGAMLDFQANGLPGVDSVRAIYTLRKVDSSEQTGMGATIR
jgi:hypothetical protein